jgi:hypothetical protein
MRTGAVRCGGSRRCIGESGAADSSKPDRAIASDLEAICGAFRNRVEGPVAHEKPKWVFLKLKNQKRVVNGNTGKKCQTLFLK